MRIYLIGYMYSGKTTVGHKLAVSLGYQWLDLDQLFETFYHTSIPIFFKRYGEEAFRKLEQKLLHSTADNDNTVVSTGGGTPCYGDNMDFILAHGTAVYLQMPVDALVERALRSRNPRPLMHGLPEPEMRALIERQLKEREPIYLRAPLIVDGINPVWVIKEDID